MKVSKQKYWLVASATVIPIAASVLYYFLRKRQSFYTVEDDDDEKTVIGTSGRAPTANWSALGLDKPLVIAMVGLPARGKSYIVKMLMRYLNWTSYEADVFNVGSYRRRIGLAGIDANFFDMNNKDSKRVREQMAMAVQEDMYKWLHEGDRTNRRVAIFDATNTTKDRRYALAQRARKEAVSLLFVESICTDDKVLQRNYDMKLQNDDYKGMDPALARADFLDRVQAYEKVYQTIEDDEDNGNVSYIKLINVGQKIIARNCTGYLPSQVAFYLQNIHIEPRRIFLSLLAEGADADVAVYNDRSPHSSVPGGILSLASLAHGHGSNSTFASLAGSQPGSGQSSLKTSRTKGSSNNLTTHKSHSLPPGGTMTANGKQYVQDLPKYLQYQQQVTMTRDGVSDLGTEIMLLTGTSAAHQATAERLQLLFPCYATPLLDELRGGDFHGMSRDQIRMEHPMEFEAREKDKLHYRYPGVGGESYMDVIERVRPVIIELERQRRSVVVVSHTAVLRCIFAYFMGTPIEKVPYLPFAHNKLYVLIPGAFGCSCQEVDVATEVSYL